MIRSRKNMSITIIITILSICMIGCSENVEQNKDESTYQSEYALTENTANETTTFEEQSSDIDNRDERIKYNDDISKLDYISTPINVFIVEEELVAEQYNKEIGYQTNYIYKLSTLMNGKTTINGKEDYIDSHRIIKGLLKDFFTDDYKFKASSRAFSGITTDDIFVCILSNGAVNIYIKSNDDDYDPFIKGKSAWAIVPTEEGPMP